MKIIHCGNIPIPSESQKIYGGKTTHPGRWVLNHAIAQKRAGMDVEVVTIAHKAKQDFITEIEGVKVHFLRTYHPYRHLTLFAIDRFRMARYIRSLHPDIVHAHGTEETYALAAIHSHIPFCVTAQGLYFQIIPTLPKPIPLYAKAYLSSETWAWKRTKYAVTKSEYVKDALEEKFPHLATCLIPNTYQYELDCELETNKKNRIAFIGTLTHRKGVHIIAEALESLKEKLPDIELVIFGNRPEGTGSEYENEQIAKLRRLLGNRLILKGIQKSDVLFKELDSCRALLAPSLEEMFGNQLIEALMRGCHGIVTDKTALAENVRRFGNGTIIPQQDAKALADAIFTEMSQPFNAERAEQARENVRAYMSPAVIAKKHLDFYTKILLDK